MNIQQSERVVTRHKMTFCLTKLEFLFRLPSPNRKSLQISPIQASHPSSPTVATTTTTTTTTPANPSSNQLRLLSWGDKNDNLSHENEPKPADAATGAAFDANAIINIIPTSTQTNGHHPSTSASTSARQVAEAMSEPHLDCLSSFRRDWGAANASSCRPSSMSSSSSSSIWGPIANAETQKEEKGLKSNDDRHESPSIGRAHLLLASPHSDGSSGDGGPKLPEACKRKDNLRSVEDICDEDDDDEDAVKLRSTPFKWPLKRNLATGASLSMTIALTLCLLTLQASLEIDSLLGGSSRKSSMVAASSMAGSSKTGSLQKLAAISLSRQNRPRWIRLPSPPRRRHPSDQSHSWPPLRSSLFSTQDSRNPIIQSLNRLTTRLGSRNTIRVHNAFRDFAWRVLSSFSMPTPVIYELRRQHFYAPADDEYNDSLAGKNTSKSIRSRRQLENYQKWPKALAQQINKSLSNQRNDDEDDYENLLDRLFSRLSELVGRRRGPFTRVINLPTLFPFKRQESDTIGFDSSSDKKALAVRKKKALVGNWRRKKRNKDRQMIWINGKQYYVGDEGELKPFEDEKSD